ncbi:putative apolipoprotein N-acyltransferase [Leptospirillum ferrooxidans C2-3]|uniref:Apolipoprotein N-acyltransferase n=1 Tax=Leptospirillum ferrooxidans (strain C2-3) TaxID=1162668 RepID=I0IMF3_LEPFC|nr:putative apolipoprotein N-acyltransferase [Leptospirillum ferrooxidans C2-3]
MGWIFGVTEALTSLWWVVQTIHHFGHLPFILSFFSLFVLSSYLGLFTGLFLFGLDIWKKNDLNNPSNPVVLALFGACLWTILEVLRSELFTGFPLNPLGDLIWGQELLTPDLSILGATGMSFAIIFISGLLSAVILPIINKLSGKTSADLFRKQSLPAIAMSVLTLSAGFGSAELLSKESSAQETQHIKVGIIQGNIPQDQKWTSQYLKDTIRTYHQLSKQALSQDAKILLWPETAIPVVIDSPPRSIAKDLQKALNLPVPIVTGTIGLHREADRFRYSFSNDAALISNNGEILDRYTKIHLVPFGEYIPFPSIFGWLRNMTGITGDLIPGKHQKLFAPFKEEDSRSLPEFYKKIRIGPVICYEAMYPSLVHQLVLKGANLLVVFTDDAWYGKTAASHQLYQQTMIRAIEEGIPLLRAANSGYSGAISGRGKLIRTSGRFTKESITLTVPLDSHETFYQKYGEWVFRFSLVIFLFLLATRAMEPHNDGIKSSPLLDDMH